MEKKKNLTEKGRLGKLVCTVDTSPRIRNGIIERQCGVCKEMKPKSEFAYGGRQLHNNCEECFKKIQMRNKNKCAGCNPPAPHKKG